LQHELDVEPALVDRDPRKQMPGCSFSASTKPLGNEIVDGAPVSDLILIAGNVRRHVALELLEPYQ
jgi:hypothetical protein